MDGSTVTLQLPDVARRRRITGGLGDGIKQRGELAAIAAAGVGQLHAAAGAGEQFGAQPLLEIADMAADRGMGDKQFGCGIGEAFVPGGGFEGLQGVQGGEAAGHVSACKVLLQVS